MKEETRLHREWHTSGFWSWPYLALWNPLHGDTARGSGGLGRPRSGARKEPSTSPLVTASYSWLKT